MSLIELSASRRITGDFGSRWVGVRRFGCPPEEVEGHVSQLQHKPWVFHSAYPGIFPRKVDWVLDDPENPGRALIVLEYGFFNIGMFPIGRATMTVDTRGKVVEAEFDITGVVPIGGKGKDTDEPGIFYTTDNNENIHVEYYTLVIIRTAYYKSAVNWPTILNHVGTVNRSRIPRLSANKRTLLMTRAYVPKYVFSNSGTVLGGWGIFGTASGEMLPIEYRFLYKRDGWPLEVTARQYEKRPYYLPVYHWKDKGDPRQRIYVKRDDPLSADGTELVGSAMHRACIKTRQVGDKYKATILEETDFTSIFGLVSW